METATEFIKFLDHLIPLFARDRNEDQSGQIEYLQNENKKKEDEINKMKIDIDKINEDRTNLQKNINNLNKEFSIFLKKAYK